MNYTKAEFCGYCGKHTSHTYYPEMKQWRCFACQQRREQDEFLADLIKQQEVKSMTKCMTPNCFHQQAQAIGNGLCLRCHSKANKAVEAGITTWEEIIGMGLALSKADSGNDPFTVALNKKLEGDNADG